jgi:hypothetical protein
VLPLLPNGPKIDHHSSKNSSCKVAMYGCMRSHLSVLIQLLDYISPNTSFNSTKADKLVFSTNSGILPQISHKMTPIRNILKPTDPYEFMVPKSGSSMIFGRATR